ncbi:MAG TPA: SAP domain-containing protein [Micromonosporaceae bacterium]
MLNRCAHCTTLFAVGLEHCPQCGNCDYYPEGSMPKISVHGGPSHEGATTEAPAPPAPEAPEAPAPEAAADDESSGDDEDADESAPVSVYETWLLADLRDACESRGLPKYGNKADLVARLVDDDKARDEI